MSSLIGPETMDWVGRELRTTEHCVTRVDIAKFAMSIGARHSMHFDPATARGLGYSDCAAPWGYHVALRMSGANLVTLCELGRDGVATDGIPPSYGSKVMAGTTDVTFHRRIVAGDQILVRTSITEIKEKLGRTGPLLFVTYAVEYVAENDEVVANEIYARIVR